MRRIRNIVIHCSDSPELMPVTADDIHQWHLARGWAGIGYHYVVLRDGFIEAGRPEYWVGAHVDRHNADTIGICLIGRSHFTAEQDRALRRLVERLIVRYDDAGVVGHRDLAKGKTCPNFDAREWWKGMALP